MLTYAIGDIHGEYDKLSQLLLKIKFDASGQKYKIVFLGDYIDRGKKSKQVLDFLMTLNSHTILMGNHEQMLQKAYRGHRDYLNVWLGNGGKECLASFGVDNVSDIPKEYINFIDSMQLTHEDDHRFYVHAGVLPGIKLSEHSRIMKEYHIVKEEVYLWIRNEFLEEKNYVWEKLIVHGHTPSKEVDIRHNRVCCDVGSYYRIAAVKFNDDGRMPIGVIYS